VGRRGRDKEKKTKTSPPLLHVWGKKKKKQCRLKTTPFRLSPFKKKNRMKQHRFV
jgi:hypothetical protein